jgi:uncharacterized low-complexity protein
MRSIALAAALAGFLIVIALVGNAVNGQNSITIKQSSTVNGQTTVTKTTQNGKSWTSEDKLSIQSGGSADVILKPGELKIHYCNEDDHCKNYVIWNNGTVTKGGEK